MSDDEREYFHFMAYRWDVTHAKQIATDLPVQRFDPQSWFGYLAMIAVDKEVVPTADLDCPVIVVRLKEANGNPMIIDGWHRIARARVEGVTDLPVVVLDEDQEYRIRIFGGRKS